MRLPSSMKLNTIHIGCLRPQRNGLLKIVFIDQILKQSSNSVQLGALSWISLIRSTPVEPSPIEIYSVTLNLHQVGLVVPRNPKTRDGRSGEWLIFLGKKQDLLLNLGVLALDQVVEINKFTHTEPSYWRKFKTDRGLHDRR